MNYHLADQLDEKSQDAYKLRNIKSYLICKVELLNLKSYVNKEVAIRNIRVHLNSIEE